MAFLRKALPDKAFRTAGKKLTLLTSFPWVNIKTPDRPRAGYLLKLRTELRSSHVPIHPHALSSTERQWVRLWVVLGLERQALQRDQAHGTARQRGLFGRVVVRKWYEVFRGRLKAAYYAASRIRSSSPSSGRRRSGRRVVQFVRALGI